MGWVRRFFSTLVTQRQSLKAQSRWLKGFQLFCRGDYENALVLLNDAEQLAPEEHRQEMVHCSLVGRCHLFLGRYKDAASTLRKATELFERSGRTQGVEREQYLLTLEAFAQTLDALNRSAEAEMVWGKLHLVDSTRRGNFHTRRRSDAWQDEGPAGDSPATRRKTDRKGT